ncbi:MAG TPA: energy transducer TonB [Treponemataceae bacterium]|nr:energy transducer TonB [Treponemataceae bacterium]
MNRKWIIRHRMPVFLAAAVTLHALAFLLIRFAIPAAVAGEEPEYAVLKLVDVEEFRPPSPPKEETVMLYQRPEASEEIVETAKAVIETDDKAYDIVDAQPEIDYLPQHKISQIPEVPSREVLAKIVYPPIALRQKIEAVVYLELFIDQTGRIRKVQILKDPGNGFAEAAVAALEGVVCKPAAANGVPVAVRFRYPVRFALN